jgi:hypothetical protein
LREIHAYNLSEIAALLWALAKAGWVQSPDIYALGGDLAGRKLEAEGKPSTVAMLVWAYGKSNVRHDVLFAKLNGHDIASRIVRGLTTQELSNLAWASAKLGYQNEELLKAVAKEATHKVGNFALGELSNLIWAFAQASFIDEKLFKAVAQEALPRLSEFSPQQQYNLLWGFLLAYSRDVGVYHCGCGRVLVRI